MKKTKTVTKELTMLGMLAVCMAIAGMVKLPSPVGGAEFQLSAPVALVIVSMFGFKRYFMIGMVSSLIHLMLGTHTLLNVLVAMVFRIVAGTTIALLGSSVLTIMLSGALGTIMARVMVSFITKVDVSLLILAAIPGIIFSTVTAVLLLPIIRRTLILAGMKEFIKGEK